MNEATQLERRERRGFWLGDIAWARPVVALVLVCGFFWTMSLSGTTPGNVFAVNHLELVARETTVVGLAVLGMTLVIIAGGIDLSIGSAITLSCVVIARSLQEGVDPAWAATLGIGAGALVGVINAFLVTRINVLPFIATLGTMFMVRGMARLLVRERPIFAPTSWINDLLTPLPGDQRWLVVPHGVWLFLILALLMAAMLRYTRFGHHLFAVGSNEQAARLCGVGVARVKFLVYVLAGCFAGIAGLMQLSHQGVGDPSAGVGLELAVIAAVVIGGGSLSGGEGSVFGSLVGALTVTIIIRGCANMGLPYSVQEVVTGAIIIAAAALDQLRHR